MKKRETTPKRRRNASAESLGIVNHAPTGIVAQPVREQDFPALAKEFLQALKRPDTGRSYKAGIFLWKSWCDAAGIQPFSAGHDDAVRWADGLVGRASTKQSRWYGVSSLYNWLVRQKHLILSSPFFGMPRWVDTRIESRTPTSREVRRILEEVPEVHKPAIIAMAYRGFPRGVLAKLHIAKNSKFETESRGKAWIGVLPPAVMKALMPLGSNPFEDKKHGTTAAAFNRATNRLAKRNEIRHAYSVRDLRRFFAVQEYAKDHNVERVALLLNLSSAKEMPTLLGWPNRFRRRKEDPGQGRKLITGLKDFIVRIAEIREEAADNSELFFRGHDDMDYKLVPSLFYRGDVEFEHAMFREMVLQNPAEFSTDMTALEKLVRMQHFSMPTRLLDFTGNPLVALFFACREQSQKTGEVAYITVPKKEIKYYDSDTVSVIANLAKVPYDEKLFPMPLIPENLDEIERERIRKEFNEDDTVKRLVHLICEEKSYFQRLVWPDDLHRVVCVKVKMNNKRIVVQDGLFLAFGIGSSQDKCAMIEQEWTPSVKDPKNRILVDWESKQTILEELDLIRMSERTLFPEMETAAKSIALRYQ